MNCNSRDRVIKVVGDTENGSDAAQTDMAAKCGRVERPTRSAITPYGIGPISQHEPIRT